MTTQVKTEPVRKERGIEMQMISPFLWFNNQAEEAANFYVSVFRNGRVKTRTFNNEESAAASGMPAGSVLTVSFQIEGHDFTAMNGGPEFRFSPATSFFVNCRTRDKIDELWSRFTPGGKVLMEIGEYPFSERYGWVEDKYGVSWQLILSSETQIITPCLMFTGERTGKAEEAINYYISVFRNSGIERLERYEPNEEGPTGALKYASFMLNGLHFSAMDAGREVPFRFTQAISFAVTCDDQQEIDYYWNTLSQGGDVSAQQCGWLKDKYDVTWQVVPYKLSLFLSDTDPVRSSRVMKALMPMKKLDLYALEKAYNGK